MMHDVEPEFADIPEIFENLGKKMSIPLYPGTKLTKTILCSPELMKHDHGKTTTRYVL
jgi:hypothetical protein